jgi:DNA-binding response OmpR family regulator
MSAGPAKPRALLVDDDPGVLRFLSIAFGRMGWEVQCLTDGQGAYEAARANLPDLVILDLMMPGLDGYAVLAHLRQDDALRDVPVVLLSGEPAGVHDAIGQELGATAYLQKPLGLAALRSFLDRLGSRSGA